MKIKTLTVSEVNNYIKKILDNDFILNNLSVRGEISNLKYLWTVGLCKSRSIIITFFEFRIIHWERFTVVVVFSSSFIDEVIIIAFDGISTL